MTAIRKIVIPAPALAEHPRSILFHERGWGEARVVLAGIHGIRCKNSSGCPLQTRGHDEQCEEYSRMTGIIIIVMPAPALTEHSHSNLVL